MEYYERFKDLREDNDLTQTQIADYLGIKQTYYSKQERGIKPIQIEQIIKLCQYYHVSADYILGLAPDMEWPRGKEQNKYIRNRTKYTFLYNLKQKTAFFDRNTANRNYKNDQCINKEYCNGWKPVLKNIKFDINQKNPFGSKCCAFSSERIFVM